MVQTTTDTDALVGVLRPLVDRVRTDVTAVKRDGKQFWTRDALTEARLRKHVTTGPARGVCPIREGESTTQVALLDLDAHGGETPWADMTAAAERIMAELERRGLRASPWRSSGGYGVHLYLLWDESQDAHSVRAELREALEAAGYRDGAGGVVAGEVEVFPKQAHVPEGGKGSQFILPLAGESVPLEPMLGLEPLPRSEAVGLEWPISDPVPVHPAEGPALPAVSSGVDLTTLASALDAIPNHGDDELDYDTWRDVIFGIHAADPGPDGLALAHELSARSAKHDPDFLDERVWPYIRSDRPGAITPATVLHVARQYGWTEPDEVVLADFEAIEAPGGGGGDDVDSRPPPFERDNNGVIKATLNNTVLALERPDCTGWRLAHDDFRDEIMLSPANEARGWRPFRDSHHTHLRLILERGAFPGPGMKPVGREMMRDAVQYVAEYHHFDSAIVWLTEEIPDWDGVPRVDRFLERYFGAEADAYAAAVSRYIWTALAGRVLDPGCQADMMPILVGDQGVGKSSGVERMVPSVDHYFEVDLRAAEDDLARRMRGRLVGEVGELRGLHSREIESIKAFITRNYEHWIPKYREFATTFPRRCIFIGTTNDEEFLADETGNRRFLPVMVGEVDRDAIDRDRPQLWAEARERYREAGIQWAEAERLAEGVHEHHMIVDPWREPIQDWLDRRVEFEDEETPAGARNRDVPFRMSDVMDGALGINPTKASNHDDRRIGSILRQLGAVKRQRRVDGARKKVWVMPDGA